MIQVATTVPQSYANLLAQHLSADPALAPVPDKLGNAQSAFTFVLDPSRNVLVAIPDTVDPAVVNNAAQATLADINAIQTAATNQRSLQQKAQNALQTNQAFLALTSPTNAQVVAEVQALARQMNALIRITLGQLDTTSGT